MRQLPIIEVEGVRYYVDERLNQLRNVEDPSDCESMEGGSEAFWLELFAPKI